MKSAKYVMPVLLIVATSCAAYRTYESPGPEVESVAAVTFHAEYVRGRIWPFFKDDMVLIILGEVDDCKHNAIFHGVGRVELSKKELEKSLTIPAGRMAYLFAGNYEQNFFSMNICQVPFRFYPEENNEYEIWFLESASQCGVSIRNLTTNEDIEAENWDQCTVPDARGVGHPEP